MVLPKATLTDTLIEGGLNPDAANRAAEMIALGYDEVAKQGEVDRRLDEQDRLNDAHFRRLEETSDSKFRTVDANFKTSDAKIEGLDTRIKDLRAELIGRIEGLKDEMDAKFAAVDKQFAAAKDSVDKQFAAVNQRIDDLKNSTDRQFRVLMWMIGLGVAAFIGLAAAVITLLLDILSRLP